MGSMNAADRLREFLAEAKLSQRGAARAMEIDERTMRRYCAGELPVPKVVWLALETVRRNRESAEIGDPVSCHWSHFQG